MKPTKEQRERWQKLGQLGCVVCGMQPVELHHLFTGGNGRKNHDHVAPLCFTHHRGEAGIHFLGRKAWRARFGEESDLLKKVENMLECMD